MRRFLKAVMAGSVVLAGAGHATGPNLEELEAELRRLQAEEARETEARRRAQEEARRAAARRQAEEEARRARLAELVLRTDAPCRLTIDGQPHGDLAVDAVESLEVLGGTQLIACESTEEAGQSVEQVVDVPAGSKALVTLELAAQVAGARREREAQARRQARWDELAVRFEIVAEGVLDKEQQVIWAARDNGGRINWRTAQDHCSAMGSGWSLPSVAQLQSLYYAESPHGQRVAGTTIRPATDLIRFTGSWYWSAEARGSSEAWAVGLSHGSRLANHQSVSYGYRALCVRRP